MAFLKGYNHGCCASWRFADRLTATTQALASKKLGKNSRG